MVEESTAAPPAHPGLAREFDRVRDLALAGLFGVAPSPPRTVGRFRLARQLGRGGMGVVYSAYDPQLDRDVALKLLRTNRLDSEDEETVRRRWLREARALAKVVHPNVVHAYEVGLSDDGEAYLAMELVDGRTLRDFGVDGGVPRERVIAVYLDAARGLAAAHEAGLVHRDFKPDNVLLAADGRARVVDFGLARASGERQATVDGPATEVQASQDSQGITRTGTVLGTPAYMAPEQRRGDAVDARADQFSWCVSLYEALLGTAPPTPLPISPRDPILAIVQRGLAEDPADRFPSMEALVEAIEAAQRPKARGHWWVAGVGATVLVGVWSVLPRPSQDPACDEAAQVYARAWNDTREESVRDHLRDAAPELADRALAHLRTSVDAHTEAWRALHANTCDGEALDAAAHATVQCLELRARVVDAVVSAVEEAPASRLVQLDRVLELPPVLDCARPDRMHERMPLPPEESRGHKVQALRLAIAEADLIRRLGDPAEAQRVLSSLAERVDAVGFEPLEAEFHHVQAEVAIESGDYARGREHAQQTVTIAKRAGAPLLEARGWVTLAMVVGYVERRTDEGHRNLDLAAAAVEQAGGDEKTEVLIDAYRGHVDLGGGRLAAALAAYRSALARERARDGASSLEGQLMDTIGTVLRRQGKLEEAEAQMRSAHALLLDRVGPRHPKTAAALMALGNVTLQRDDPNGAIELYERAREALGDTPSEIRPRLLNNLGQAYQEAERFEDAETILRAAVALLESQGNETIERARALSSLSRALRKQGRAEESLATVESALAVGERAVGREHPELSRVLLNRALSHEAVGNAAEARRDAERVVALTADGSPNYKSAHDGAQRVLARLAADSDTTP